jgi:hypothetical protein
MGHRFGPSISIRRAPNVVLTRPVKAAQNPDRRIIVIKAGGWIEGQGGVAITAAETGVQTLRPGESIIGIPKVIMEGGVAAQ